MATGPTMEVTLVHAVGLLAVLAFSVVAA